MNTRRLRWTSLLTLGLALVASACEPATTGPEIAAGDAFAASTSGNTWEKVLGDMPTFSITKTIGSEGGKISVAEGFSLVVPKNSVSAPTEFTFASVNDGYVEVKLTATSLGSSVENDAGSAGFNVPVKLVFDVHPAGGMMEWQRYVVAWVRPDDTLEPVPTYISPSQRKIWGLLDHFSQYVLAQP